MKLLALILAAAAAAPALASVTAFSNFNCAGTALVVPCDDSCHSFSGKNSFRASVDTDTVEHCVGSFTGTTCASSTFVFPNPNQNGECTNIEASSPILSFSCSPNNTCSTGV